jgi:hypothetical protein
MFGKSKLDSAPFPRHEFADRLDALIAGARSAGMNMTAIADKLERYTDQIRAEAAVSINLSTVPTMFDAFGNPRT